MLDVVLHKVAGPLNIENSRYIPGMCVVTQATCRFSEEISENWASSMKGYRKIKTERAICEESYDWTALPRRGGASRPNKSRTRAWETPEKAVAALAVGLAEKEKMGLRLGKKCPPTESRPGDIGNSMQDG